MTVKIESMDSSGTASTAASIIKADESESLSPHRLVKSSSRDDNDVKYEIDYINNNGNRRDGMKKEATDDKRTALSNPNHRGYQASNDGSTDGLDPTATAAASTPTKMIPSMSKGVVDEGNINEETADDAGLTAIDQKMTSTTDVTTSNDDSHHDSNHSHRRNQSATSALMIVKSTGFSPPQSTNRKMSSKSEVVLTASSIANNVTTAINNEEIVRNASSSDGTISSLGNSSNDSTTIAANEGETSDPASANDIEIADDQHRKMTKQNDRATTISIRTRSSSKKVSCVSRRMIPTRNNLHQQQQKQHLRDGDELANNSKDVSSKIRADETGDNVASSMGAIIKEVNYDVSRAGEEYDRCSNPSIMRFNDGPTSVMAVNRRDRNGDPTAQSVTSIKAELDAAAMEQDGNRDQDKKSNRNLKEKRRGEIVNHQRDKEEGNSHDPNSSDNTDDNNHNLYHQPHASPHRRGHNLQGIIDGAVNHVNCKQKAISCDDDDEEDTDLGFDFVTSPPRPSYVQGSRGLQSNGTSIDSAHVSDPTPPGSARSHVSRQYNSSDQDNDKESNDRMEKEVVGGEINNDIVVEPSSSSPPRKVSDQRNESSPQTITNRKRSRDSGSVVTTCNEPSEGRSLHANDNSYPEQQRQTPSSQQLPHHTHQRQHQHRRHHIPNHHKSQYHNSQSNNTSTINGQYQQQYHYMHPASSSMSSSNDRSQRSMQHFPQHYGSGMHHLHQPHHLHPHHLDHHNSLGHHYSHHSNDGGSMMWGRHPPSPDYHELGSVSSGTRHGGIGSSTRTHRAQSPPLKNEGNVGETPNETNKSYHARKNSMRHAGENSPMSGGDKIIMRDYHDDDDGQNVSYSPPGKKKRRVMDRNVPTSWDEDRHHVQDYHGKVDEKSHHHDHNENMRKVNDSSSRLDNDKMTDEEDRNRRDPITALDGNGMEKEELLIQSPAVFRTASDPKRSPIFSNISGTPTPYNYNGVSFGMMDTPTPGRIIKLDDVFHESRSFGNDSTGPSILRSFADIETPNKTGGESNAKSNMPYARRNLLAERGEASLPLDFDENMAATPLTKSMSMEGYTPKKSIGRSRGGYSRGQDFKPHTSPFPLLHQELSPFHHGRLMRSPVSISPNRRHPHHNQNITRGSEDRFSQQRPDFNRDIHHHPYNRQNPASPYSSPLPLGDDNSCNLGITLPSLPSPRADQRDRHQERYERYPSHTLRHDGRSGLPKTSPMPRRPKISSPSATRQGQSQKKPLFENDQEYPSPDGFRIKIGGGMEQTKAMEGINTALKGGHEPNRAMHLNQRHPGVSPEDKVRGINGHILQHPLHNKNHHNTNTLQTPIKMKTRPSPFASTSSLTMPGGAPSSDKRSKYLESGGGNSSRNSPPIALGIIPPGRVPIVAGQGELSHHNRNSTKKDLLSLVGNVTTDAKSNKENEKPKGRQKRNPCNCKRSKCLKLYCECFAAEIFCDGCNCINCHNTKKDETVRNKAIKDTKTKNKNAFDTNVGCRCKKSACLKKYCECFEAGSVCSARCKCVGCKNYVGSQALIDRRRKIKDHKGADRVMRAADEYWKGNNPNVPPQIGSGGIRNPPIPPPLPGMFASPVGQHQHGHGHRMGGHHPIAPHMRMHHHHPMMSPSMHGAPQHYMGPPHVMMGHSMGYSPVAMHQNPTPPFQSSSGLHRSGNLTCESGGGSGSKEITSSSSVSKMRQGIVQYGMPSLANTPKTPASRRGFDPHSSKKKNPGEKEKVLSYFGSRNPGQTKNSALAIFSFLSNDDIYNASLVSKAWSKLSLDEELWQFEEA